MDVPTKEEEPGRLAAPGWYPNPQPGPNWRYWDGWVWTEHFSDGAQTSPVPNPPFLAPVAKNIRGAKGAWDRGDVTYIHTMEIPDLVRGLRKTVNAGLSGQTNQISAIGWSLQNTAVTPNKSGVNSTIYTFTFVRPHQSSPELSPPSLPVGPSAPPPAPALAPRTVLSAAPPTAPDAAPALAPGWYTDPLRPDLLRWWDGTTWVEKVVMAPADGTSPAPADRTSEGLANKWWLAGILGGLVIVGLVVILGVAGALTDTEDLPSRSTDSRPTRYGPTATCPEMEAAWNAADEQLIAADRRYGRGSDEQTGAADAANRIADDLEARPCPGWGS